MDAVTLRIHANLINEMHGALDSGPVSLWFRRRVRFNMPEAEPAQMGRELNADVFDLPRRPMGPAESGP